MLGTAQQPLGGKVNKRIDADGHKTFPERELWIATERRLSLFHWTCTTTDLNAAIKVLKGFRPGKVATSIDHGGSATRPTDFGNAER